MCNENNHTGNSKSSQVEVAKKRQETSATDNNDYLVSYIYMPDV